MYISQNVHLFHEQPLVTCRMSEPPSAGGRKTGSMRAGAPHLSRCLRSISGMADACFVDRPTWPHGTVCELGGVKQPSTSFDRELRVPLISLYCLLRFLTLMPCTVVGGPRCMAAPERGRAPEELAQNGSAGGNPHRSTRPARAVDSGPRIGLAVFMLFGTVVVSRNGEVSTSSLGASAMRVCEEEEESV